MKTWTWLLPCWIWKFFFEQLGKRPVHLENQLRYAVRIDDEFVLVLDPVKSEPAWTLANQIATKETRPVVASISIQKTSLQADRINFRRFPTWTRASCSSKH